MSSSDSETDCYGNIAQKLQSMKNTFQEDKLEVTNLLNDSTECIMIPRTISLPDKDVLLSVNTSIESNNSEELTLDSIIASNSKRVMRSRKLKGTACVQECPKQSTKGRRGRGRGRQSSDVAPDNNALVRGRGRGSTTDVPPRSRRRTGGNTVNTMLSQPIYSVGNTDEYPDHSDSQAIFTWKSDDVVVLDENDPLDENEELSVKVYWQSSEFFKFPIRRYQKLTQLFDFFAKKENIHHDKLLFTYNEKILKMEDTPDSIGYSIVKFIDGGVTNESISRMVIKDKNTRNGIKIKFQCQNARKPYEMVIGHDDKLMVAMLKCAEQLELPLKNLKFLFDGDTITGSSTPRQLELEGGECIDVKIMS